MFFQDRLMELKDEKYQVFQAKIVPNVSLESIIGVRVPQIRNLAKELFNDPAKEEFLNELPHKYYEENLLHIMLVCLERDFDTCVKGMDRFLPYADNWAVTDQPSPKSFRKKHRELIPVIKKWLQSDHVYTARFAIDMFMHEFLDEDFSVEYPELICKKHGDDYYLKMVIAWYFATALAKQYEAVIPYIEEHRLDVWTHNKAIQKAIESYRITDEQKTYLRTLKIR